MKFPPPWGEVDRDRRGEALRRSAESLAAGDIQAAIAMGPRIPDIGDQIEFLRAVLAGWAANRPVEALPRAVAYPAGLLRTETLNAALGAWAARHPRSALAWVEENADGPMRDEALVTVATSWAARAPEAAGACMVRGFRFHFAGGARRRGGRVGDADSVAYGVEAKYKFTPKFFGALRWNQQFFAAVPDGAGERGLTHAFGAQFTLRF